jgi:hypothetical protein
MNRLSPALSALRVPCVMNPQLHGECFHVFTLSRWHVTCIELEYRPAGRSLETLSRKAVGEVPRSGMPISIQ